jgi:hypothetical protein
LALADNRATADEPDINHLAEPDQDGDPRLLSDDLLLIRSLGNARSAVDVDKENTHFETKIAPVAGALGGIALLLWAFNHFFGEAGEFVRLLHDLRDWQVAVAVVALALLGFGAWLVYRGRRRRSILLRPEALPP